MAEGSQQLQSLASPGVTRKVGAGAIAGAVLTIALAVANAFDIEVTAELATAIGTILTLAIQYVVRDRARAIVAVEEIPDDPREPTRIAAADDLERDDGDDSWHAEGEEPPGI